jgi:hypothetical protein
MSTIPPGGPAPLPTATPAEGPRDAASLVVSVPQQQEAPSLKRFTLESAPPTVTARVHLPGVLPDFEPFVFVMRLTFSEHMQKKRDAFLALAPAKQVETEEEEILTETCDLLAQDPTGFGDFDGLTMGGSPGQKLRNYYVRAERTSPHAFAIVKSVIRAANNIYWGSVTPREFFPPTADNSAGESAIRQEGSE